MATAAISSLVATPLLGFATGLRTMTPLAVFCWFACLGYLPVSGTWAFWTAKSITVVVFSVLAGGEYFGDKLPKTPSRLTAFPLASRLVFGGLVGALVATVLVTSRIESIALGPIAAALGAFGGFHLRRRTVRRSDWPDWRFATLEDAFALAVSLIALKVVSG